MSRFPAWHATPQALQQYADGSLTDAFSWSLETHLPECDVCRERLAAVLSEPDRAELVMLHEVVKVARPSYPTAASRWTPARSVQRGVLGPWWSWVLALLAVFASITLLGRAPLPPTSLLTSWATALAPLVPLAMVAMVYAVADRDPATLVTPRGGLELVLIRTLVILAWAIPTVVLGMVAGHTVGWLWLLPGLVLCFGALALGPTVGLERACVGLAVVWAVLVVAATPPVALTLAANLVEPSGQTSVLWGVALVTIGGVIVLRRDQFDLPGRLS